MNTCGLDGLVNLAKISSDSAVVEDLKASGNFYNMVIDHFTTTKGRRMAFLFEYGEWITHPLSLWLLLLWLNCSCSYVCNFHSVILLIVPCLPGFRGMLVSPLKAAVGRIFWASLGKNSIITFQHIVIQVLWEITTLLHLLVALFSGFKNNLALDGRLWPITGHFRERAFILSLPIGCAPAGGRCFVFPLQISTLVVLLRLFRHRNSAPRTEPMYKLIRKCKNWWDV